MCKLRDVPVGEQARKIWPLDERFFSDFVGGKSSIPLSASNDLRLSEPKTLIQKTYKIYKISSARMRLSNTWQNLLPF